MRSDGVRLSKRGRRESVLILAHPGLEIRIVIKTRLSKRLRRQILLLLYRAAKTPLKGIRALSLDHSDSGLYEMIRQMGRPISLHQALVLNSSASAEGLNVRMQRLSLHLSQAVLAELCGITRPHLSKIERGKVQLRAITRAKLDFGFRLARSRLTKTQLPTAVGQSFRRGLFRSRTLNFAYQGSSSPSKSKNFPDSAGVSFSMTPIIPATDCVGVTGAS